MADAQCAREELQRKYEINVITLLISTKSSIKISLFTVLLRYLLHAT